jgi:hypothetical protein
LKIVNNVSSGEFFYISLDDRRQTAVLPLRLRAQAGWAYASKPQTAAGEVA